MIGAVILCIGLIGPGGGGGFATAAAVVPPSLGTPTAPPASHRRDDDGDIPFFAPGFFRLDRRSRKKRGGDRSSGRTRGRRMGGGRRGDDDDEVSDVAAAAADGRDHDASENDDGGDDGGDDRGPPLFFSGLYDDSDDSDDDGRRRDRYERDRRRRTNGRRRGRGGGRRNDDGRRRPPLDPVRRWALEKTGVRIPRIHVHFDPATILKLRKSWHGVVPGAIVRVGADFETRRGRLGGFGGGVWRLRGCVEDKLIGGRLTIREGGGRGGRGGGTTTVAADRCLWSTRSRGCFPAQVSSAQASSVEIRSGALLPYILCGFYTPYRRCVADAAPKTRPPPPPPRIRRHPVQFVRRVRPGVPQGQCSLRIPIGERRRLGRGLPAEFVWPEGILRIADCAAGRRHCHHGRRTGGDGSRTRRTGER